MLKSTAPYLNYQFTVKSKKTGRLDTLDPILIDHDGDDANNNRLKDNDDRDETAAIVPAPALRQLRCTRVNPLSGLEISLETKGGDDADPTDERAYIQYYGPDLVERAFTIDPMDVYSGESNIDFTMTFEAKGPMYAVGSDMVTITVPIPTALHPI